MKAQSQTLSAHVPVAVQQALPPSPRSAHTDELPWDGPTVREMVERVEHQFGATPGLSGLFALGFGSDEWLTPGDVQAVCDHLGLPAADFGVDP